MEPEMQTARKDFKIPAGIFVFGVVLAIVLGWFGWKAADFRMPDFWYDNISDKQGIWKEGSPLQKFDAWRVESIKKKWIASSQRLVLPGTVWRNDEPVGKFYEFGEDGIFRMRPEKSTYIGAISALSGTRFEFIPSKGHYAISYRTSYSRPNLFFYDGTKQVGHGCLGYNGTNLWLVLRKPEMAHESRMTPVTPNSELPPAIEPATISP